MLPPTTMRPPEFFGEQVAARTHESGPQTARHGPADSRWIPPRSSETRLPLPPVALTHRNPHLLFPAIGRNKQAAATTTRPMDATTVQGCMKRVVAKLVPKKGLDPHDEPQRGHPLVRGRCLAPMDPEVPRPQQPADHHDLSPSHRTWRTGWTPQAESDRSTRRTLSTPPASDSACGSPTETQSPAETTWQAEIDMPSVADALRQHAPAYLRQYQDRMPAEQKRVLALITRCRTGELGFLHYQCASCPRMHWVARSCGNRHCPHCQSDKAQRWLAARMAQLLPVPYFLATFTVPAALRPCVRAHPRVCYPALFDAASQTIRELTAGKRFAGTDRLGFFAHYTPGGETSPTTTPMCISWFPAEVSPPTGPRWQACPKIFSFRRKLLPSCFRASSGRPSGMQVCSRSYSGRRKSLVGWVRTWMSSPSVMAGQR